MVLESLESILWQVNNSNGNHADSFSIEIFDARQELGDWKSRFEVSIFLVPACAGTIGTGETTHRIPWKVVELQSEEPLKQLFLLWEGQCCSVWIFLTRGYYVLRGHGGWWALLLSAGNPNHCWPRPWIWRSQQRCAGQGSAVWDG